MRVSLSVIAIILLATLLFGYPRYGYGEGSAVFYGASFKDGRTLDPAAHLDDIYELLRSLGYKQIPVDRVAMQEVPVLADHSPGYLEAIFTKQITGGNKLLAKVYSTETKNHTKTVGIRTVFTNATVFDILIFSRENGFLEKRIRELRNDQFKKIQAEQTDAANRNHFKTSDMAT